MPATQTKSSHTEVKLDSRGTKSGAEVTRELVAQYKRLQQMSPDATHFVIPPKRAPDGTGSARVFRNFQKQGEMGVEVKTNLPYVENIPHATEYRFTLKADGTVHNAVIQYMKFTSFKGPSTHWQDYKPGMTDERALALLKGIKAGNAYDAPSAPTSKAP
jgi:hypothetical protein